MDLHNIREDYTQQELSAKQCDADPLKQFEKWLNEAINAKVNEPTAMNIATINEKGFPSSRVVLLKELTPQGFVFFTNYHSQKGQALTHNPVAALNFFWPELERQVRIEGKVTKLDKHASDEYFESRPYISRIGAWASEQSAVISSKSFLLSKAAMIAAKHPLHVPRPPHWGGYIVQPTMIEFWQGRPSRLHDRIRYRLDHNEWIKERLSP
ncbi:pyridoxamine 5'-phosphate oxidase [[Actinobacillus] rossii]|uniref:Pyridoxine/pyridoxamine 5'-phosphate oxidase n=1 Tax=[Actinobacillus] rossii TaxID=123820 RepID=A0A380TP11_9PAST|nr:pyridoxamine 5'-phosphate oxidase [[Actinobacillus] rossii]